MLTHYGAAHELVFKFIRQHPFGEQESFVSSAPVEPVESIGFAFLLMEAWLGRTNQHGDTLDDWTKRQAYFLGKDLQISGPLCERWRQVHKSASNHLISEAREMVR